MEKYTAIYKTHTLVPVLSLWPEAKEFQVKYRIIVDSKVFIFVL